ncbi:MAG: DeoR family transcriptional regulator [Desulfobulbaceae bacterium]|nr:DeoR family transcriptional regulator [Desulfobulbaceae bacterium]
MKRTRLSKAAEFEHIRATHYQLHTKLYEEKPKYADDPWLGGNQEDEDLHAELLEEIRSMAHEWMFYCEAPEELEEVTLVFLRKEVEGWKEYEEDLEREEFLIRIKEWFEKKGQKVAAIFQAADDDEALAYQAEEVVRKYIKDHDEFIQKEKELANKFFPRAEKEKKDIYPMVWMKNNKKIREIYETKQGKRRFQLFNELWKVRMTPEKSSSVLQGMTKKFSSKDRIFLGSLESENKAPLLVQVDVKSLAAKFEVSDDTVRSDLKKWEYVGAVIRLGKPGSHEYSVYLIGKASGFKNAQGVWVPRKNPSPLLKNTKAIMKRLSEGLK